MKLASTLLPFLLLEGGAEPDYAALAARITGALRLQAGERVLIRFDPGYFHGLVGPLRRRIRDAGAIDLAAIEYIESASVAGAPGSDETRAAAFERSLEATDCYLWLPLRAAEREMAPGEARALARWLARGGARREIHFHWSAGSVEADGLAGPHTAELDAIYRDALDVDYAELRAVQERAIRLLRSGTVRVRTPAGTDVSFRVGERPFNRQDGDASPERVSQARVRVDREIELPAGVVRVAPVEESVGGRIVIAQARFGDAVARGIRLEIERGRVTRVEAAENLPAVEAALAAGGAAARRFREFGLGCNPKLRAPAGSRALAYYGYGAGVVRLSLGDNSELAGAVTGGFVRWFFFPDATVTAGGRDLVRDGRLMDSAAAR